LTAVRSVLTIADSNVVVSEKAGGDPTVSQAVVTNVLTAHPNSVFVIVGLNDETVVGALHALDAAHRLGDAVTVSLGADKLGREALRNPTYANTLLGAVDFNPYAEAWDLIAAAVAIARGETFKPYSISTFLTASTVNTYYPLPDNRV
jgi:ABC-type sugar transport system substrate-binding protein